jgi:hypothetical protein
VSSRRVGGLHLVWLLAAVAAVEAGLRATGPPPAILLGLAACATTVALAWSPARASSRAADLRLLLPHPVPTHVLILLRLRRLEPAGSVTPP